MVPATLKAPLASGAGVSCCFLPALPLAGLPLSSSRSGERGVDLPLLMSLLLPLGCRCGDLQHQQANESTLCRAHVNTCCSLPALDLPSLLSSKGRDGAYLSQVSAVRHQTTHPHTARKRAQ